MKCHCISVNEYTNDILVKEQICLTWPRKKILLQFIESDFSKVC